MSEAALDAEFIEADDAVHADKHGQLVVVKPAPPTFFSAMRPAEKVAFATEVADALKPILIAKKLVKKLNRQNPDDEYVELEGWQTCGFMCNMTAKVLWTKPLEDGSGYEARAAVVRLDNGVEIGGGEGMCSRKESKWQNRDDFAIKSMAQTRAQSRALRGQLAWILVLAGYKPTPAAEMPDQDVPTGPKGQPATSRATEGGTSSATQPKPATDDNAKDGARRVLFATFPDLRNDEWRHAYLQRVYGKVSFNDLNLEQLRDLYSRLKNNA